MALRGHCGCGGALKAKGSSLRAVAASLVSDGGKMQRGDGKWWGAFSILGPSGVFCSYSGRRGWKTDVTLREGCCHRAVFKYGWWPGMVKIMYRSVWCLVKLLKWRR